MNNSYDFGTILSVLFIIAAVASSLWLLVFFILTFSRSPLPLRGHLVTAIVWTSITGFQTMSLLLNPTIPNVIGQAVVFIAGWVMISSWAQFGERRRGELSRQHRRWLPHRLFVQTLLGPLALGLCSGMVAHEGQRLFRTAFLRGDLPTVFLLQHYGFEDTYYYYYGNQLEGGIRSNDLNRVSAYLAVVKSSNGWYGGRQNTLEAAIGQKNVAITRLLLKYGVSPQEKDYGSEEYPLHTAVKSGNVRQVQVLLEYGAERKVYNQAGETPFQLAKQRHDTAMMHALATPPRTKALPSNQE